MTAKGGKVTVLKRLQEIALEAHGTDRGELLRLLTQCVFSDRQPSAVEVALFADITLQLLAKVDPQTRTELATVVAHCEHLPAPLLSALCEDIPEVAAPVLVANPALGEETLKDWAGRLSNPHLAAIARRPQLTTAVTDLLFERGDMTVWRTVAANAEAEISPRFLRDLLAKAETDDELCVALTRRSDLPEADAEHLVMLVAKRLRGRIANRPAPQPSPTAAPAAPVTPPHLMDMAALLAQIKAGRLSVDAVVADLAGHDRCNDLAAILAHVADIDELSVLKVLVRSDASGAIKLLRGIDVSPKTFDVVVKMRRRRLGFSEAQVRFEREDYLRMDPAEARRTVAQFARKRHHAG
ncbi:DUF2336 domain-containing protein [Prosthecodimorpha staleyi]|nr:DUF2336 domain-containing protein [Prosthecodimorpha staleyi]